MKIHYQKLLFVFFLFWCLPASCSHPPTGIIRIANENQDIQITGFDACFPNSPNTIKLDSEEPLVIMVHGCNASGENLKTLSLVFKHQGQQTLCFNYNDRDSIEYSSKQLISAVDELVSNYSFKKITIIGHSQGGLVARRALTNEKKINASEKNKATFQLVTISSPFKGIEASSHCGLIYLHVLSLGISAGICQIATGDKWTEIYPGSDFVDSPGYTNSSVKNHTKIVTDERDTCLIEDDNGNCEEDDEVFSVHEQYHTPIDSDKRVTNIEIREGHSRVIGYMGNPPYKLINILQEYEILNQSALEESLEFNQFLVVTYTKYFRY